MESRPEEGHFLQTLLLACGRVVVLSGVIQEAMGFKLSRCGVWGVHAILLIPAAFTAQPFSSTETIIHPSK